MRTNGALDHMAPGPLSLVGRTASLYRFVLKLLVLLDVVALTRRLVGVRGSLLGSAARTGRASAHTAKSFPAYTLPVRSPVSRAAAIAAGGLSRGGRGHKSHEGGNQRSMQIAHGRSSKRTACAILLKRPYQEADVGFPRVDRL